jgi:hypothetical protein
VAIGRPLTSVVASESTTWLRRGSEARQSVRTKTIPVSGFAGRNVSLTGLPV